MKLKFNKVKGGPFTIYLKTQKRQGRTLYNEIKNLKTSRADPLRFIQKFKNVKGGPFTMKLKFKNVKGGPFTI